MRVRVKDIDYIEADRDNFYFNRPDKFDEGSSFFEGRNCIIKRVGKCYFIKYRSPNKNVVGSKIHSLLLYPSGIKSIVFKTKE
jgi:hypothetical protein